jgi:SAM-dependent methyltransferase
VPLGKQMRSSSSFVSRCLEGMLRPFSGLALDIPSGRGRHSIELASAGFHVVSADIDVAALRDAATASNGSDVNLVQVDAQRAIPFRSAAFSLVIVVDYVHRGLLSEVARVLAPGGYLIYQTFGSHGENWRELPQRGETLPELGIDFEIVNASERTAGRPELNRVSVNLLAVKRPAG